MTTWPDEFCPRCDVAMFLHDGPDSCEAAERNAHIADLANRAERDMRRKWGY